MRPGPRRSLKQSDIVAVAFEILAASGFAAVSIRGVAAALNLTPTAMYTYFASKQELLRAMVDELVAGIGDASAGAETDASSRADASPAPAPRAVLLAAAVELRGRLRAHPGAVGLVTGEAVAGPGMITLVERLGEEFVRAGLAADDAARAAHAVLAHTIGQVALEQAWGGASADAGATLWTDEPERPIADAGAALGLREGDDAEFDAATARIVDAWAGPAR